ncbi:ShlB/FhaC/HecB family hemolysin secretion/activation protein [Pseudomonas cremoricolorata]|uniref:ShlB/FhaC/HecB family hemolysin secretion/activation protein n=1 Tax=Pseudomonas cremoricolorata TaxID=157783 RepID=UPI000424845C|nr:ShlB/FhaC/HecB family hemolysin secretion/activation protein [Pseudomonas cremoricolorata]
MQSLAMADDLASRQLREQHNARQAEQTQQRLQRWQRDRSEPPAPATASPSLDEPCQAVSGIRLSGHRQLDDAQLQRTIEPYLRPCMGVGAINQLLRAITQRYIDAGYPMARPLLRSQPQHGAPLDIVVVEGFVESIEFADDSLPLSLRGAFPDLLGKPLHLPDVEQGLDQLNRLRAFELGSDLLPGELEGGTRVVVKTLRRDDPWYLDVRLNNRGNDATGHYQMGLSAGVDSPFGVNDELRLNLSGTRFDAPGRSQNVALEYAVPYGRWRLGVGVSSSASYLPLGRSGNFKLSTSSRSQTSTVMAERVLWRSQRGLLSGVVQFDNARLRNHLAGHRLTLQSPDLFSVDTSLHLLWLEQGLWKASLGVAQIRQRLSDQRHHTSSTRMDKYRAELTYLSPADGRRKWYWHSQATLQYSADPLPALHQLAVTNHFAVRGFRELSVNNTNGAVWRNTILHPLRPLPSSLPALQLRPFIGLDLGWSRSMQHKNAFRLSSEHDSQRLAGASAGVELLLPKHSLRLEYQQPLYASAVPHSALEPGFWLFELNLSL